MSMYIQSSDTMTREEAEQIFIAAEAAAMARYLTDGNDGAYTNAVSYARHLRDVAQRIAAEAERDVVIYKGHQVDMRMARSLMDDEICDQIHGTVDTEQEFFDAYVLAHAAKFGEDFVIG